MDILKMTNQEKWFLNYVKSDNFKQIVETVILQRSFTYKAMLNISVDGNDRSMQTALGMFLRKYCPKMRRKKYTRNYIHHTYYEFPSREECLEDFYAEIGEKMEVVTEYKNKCPMCGNLILDEVAKKILDKMCMKTI